MFVFLSENVITFPKLIHKFNRLQSGDAKGERREEKGQAI